MIHIRNVNECDYSTLRYLAENNYPLDIHTHYTYYVLTHMFDGSCFLLFEDQEPIGYITSVYNEECLFIWQIGILEQYRGNGYSQMLIDEVVKVARNKELSMLVTIAEDNQASYAAFSKYCTDHRIKFYRTGEVKLRDLNDPLFNEDENVYHLEINN